MAFDLRQRKIAAFAGRQQWLSHLRTFGWVAAITLLVWVWADLERTEQETLTVTIRIQAPRGSDLRIVSPDGGAGEQVSFSVIGARGSLDGLLEQIRRDPLVLIYQADPTWRSGPQELDMVELLNDWSRLQEAGVTVNSAMPAFMEVQVDRWVPVRADVRVTFTGTGTPAGEPAVNPAEVNIRVPASQISVTGTEPAIGTRAVDLTGKPVGVQITETVPLAEGIAGVPVELGEVRQVEISYRIQAHLQTRQVPVVVEVKIPPSWLEIGIAGSYELIRNPISLWRRDLTIEGPREEIERLRIDEVRAFVDLRGEQPPIVGSWLTSEVTVMLPPNLRLRDPLPGTWSVDYRFERRTIPAQ